MLNFSEQIERMLLMGEIFEKLLLENEILTEEELLHYKKMLAQNPKKKTLGNLLIERGLATSDVIKKFIDTENESIKKEKLAKKSQLDQKLLQIVQELGLVEKRDIALCIKEQKDANLEGRLIFLSDLFLSKKYLTKYLIKKIVFSKHDNSIILEDSVLNIPQYLRDRFLGKIILKNNILDGEQFSLCWEALKQAWPNKGLAEIILTKNLLSENKIKILLQVLKRNLSHKYPFFDAQIRDWEMAKLLAKRQFLSAGRLNKCLMQQLDAIKHKQYISLRKILVEQGYLSDYLFDAILKSYGALVSYEPPGVLVPSEEISIFPKEDIEKAIKEAKSDVHLIIEEDDIATLNLREEFLKQAEVTSEIIEINDFDIDIEEEESKPSSIKPKKDEPGDAIFKNFETEEKVLTPNQISLVQEEKNEDFLDIDVEDEDLDIDLGADAKEFVAEDFSDHLRKIEPVKMPQEGNGTIPFETDNINDDSNDENMPKEIQKLEKKTKKKNTEI